MLDLNKFKLESSIVNNLKERKELVLTEDQTKALQLMNEWLYKPINEPDDCFFTLTGSAGTGKTSIIAELLKDLSYPFKNRVCVSAPTHKARKMISIKSGCKDSETVQSLLGLKPDVNIDNFDVNDPIFSPIAPKKLNEYKLTIIDESSMVNVDLYNIIKEDTIRFKSKLLFIGDLKQLSPIEKSENNYGKKVFTEVLSKTLTEPKNKYNLTQVVRQENTNPLLELLEVLRKDIDEGTNKYLEFLDSFPVNIRENGQGYEVLDSEKTAEIAIKLFKEGKEIENKNYIRYISWTNDSIEKFNYFIRKEALQTTDIIIVNEAFLSYSSLPHENNPNENTIINSEDYIVESFEKGERQEGNFLIKFWNVKLIESDSGRKTSAKILIPSEENYKNYLAARQLKLDIAIMKRGKYFPEYYAFRHYFCLLKNLYEGKKVIDKKNIDYGYGITIHKSQGSTFENIIINGKNINKNINEIERRKLWYVALSRASKTAYIIL